MDLTPLESNLYKSDRAVISHIIHMIEVDNFWLQKTFEVVLADLWRNHNKSMNKKMRLYTVQKMRKPMKRWMRKRLLTSAVKVRLQPVNTGRAKKVRNEKITAWRRVKQSQGWRVKTGLKRIIKWKKLRKTKFQ